MSWLLFTLVTFRANVTFPQTLSQCFYFDNFQSLYRVNWFSVIYCSRECFKFLFWGLEGHKRPLKRSNAYLCALLQAKVGKLRKRGKIIKEMVALERRKQKGICWLLVCGLTHKLQFTFSAPEKKHIENY